ncbi:AarF/UbiB family protein [Eubacteriales bacterium mix99]
MSKRLPDGVVKELKKLQDSVPPFPFPQVRTLIESEFHDSLEHIYQEFDPEPIAAASVSQVHRATLFSGVQVAVKVQRPEIEDTIDLDLDIMKSMAHFIDHTKYGKLYDFNGMVEDFESAIKAELNFMEEGENADTFLHHFQRDEGITVPKVKWIYTTKRVLTMEYSDGLKISDLEELDRAGLDRRKIGERIATSICNQILRDGFFHADPHPGNIQVLPDGTVVFLDTGMVGRLDETRREMISRFFVGVTSKDSGMVVRSLVDMDVTVDQKDMKNFEKDVDTIVAKYLTMPMDKIRIDDLIREVFHTVYLNHIKIPHEFTLLAKTLATLQGVLEKLAPDLNAISITEPIAKKLVYQSFSLRKVKKQVRKEIWRFQGMLHEFPAVMQNILHRIGEQDFSVPIEIKGGDSLQKQLSRITNRISLSVIMLALSIVLAGILISFGLIAGNSGVTIPFALNILKTGLIVSVLFLLIIILFLIRSYR